MGILDNLGGYLEKTGKIEKCHYCNNEAKYNDTVKLDQNEYGIYQAYALEGVCEKHAYRGLTS